MNGPERQKDSGNKEQPKAEKQRRIWRGKGNLDINFRGSKAGSDDTSLGLDPPPA